MKLIELGEVGNLGKEVGGSVLDWPLVNLCLVACEVRCYITPDSGEC